MNNKVDVLRISRHNEGNESREEALKKGLGAEVNITTVDVPYGKDPVEAIRNKITELGINPVAVEAIAPMPVLAKLTDRRNGLGLPVLRSNLERGDDGRPVVIGQEKNGRDILKVGSYDVVDRVKMQTYRLEEGEIDIPEEGAVVLRIARKGSNPSRVEALQEGLGSENFEIVVDDVRYGNDPVKAITEVIEKVEAEGKKVIGVDASASMPVLAKLTDRRFGLQVPVLRDELKRENGRVVVVGQDEETGRDILAIDHYSVVDRVVLDTHELGSDDIVQDIRGKLKEQV